MRIGNRPIDRSVVVFCPGVTRHLLASQQIMFDARENAAPVTTVKSLVNNPIDLYINSVAAENFVINAAQQIEQTALLAGGGICNWRMKVQQIVGRRVVFTPRFGFVWIWLRPTIFFTHPALRTCAHFGE